GHGYSDIPEGEYDATFFARSVGGFLDALDLHDTTLCGVSIGGAAALLLAGQHHPRVGRVVAINPYDYAKRRGMARGGWLGWMLVTTSQTRVAGPRVLPLQPFTIRKGVWRGGVANPASIPAGLLREMNAVGARRGHHRAFVRLLRHSASWEAATRAYQ